MSKIATIKIDALHVGKSVSFECAQLSVEQQFSPTWAAQDAYGKMDPIATYANTKRNATFEFTVLGKQPDSAQALQAKIDLLTKIQYPRYNSSGGGQILAGPPVFSVSVLNNSIYSVFKGYFTSFTVNPGSSQAVPPLSVGNRFFERKYDVSLGLQVLHSYIPGWIGDGDPGGSEGFVFEGTGVDGSGGTEVVPNVGGGYGGQSIDPSLLTGPVNFSAPQGSTPLSPEDVFDPSKLGGGATSAQTTEDREALSPDQQEKSRTGVA